MACDLVRVNAYAACFARGAHAYRPSTEYPGAASAPNIDSRPERLFLVHWKIGAKSRVDLRHDHAHEHGVKRFEQAPDSIREIERLERFERASQMSPSDETE